MKYPSFNYRKAKKIIKNRLQEADARLNLNPLNMSALAAYNYNIRVLKVLKHSKVLRLKFIE